MDMLEKAARAFFEAHPWGDLDDCGPLHTWETLPDEWREYYRKGTRAVLLAVREPDEAMVLAGAECVWDEPGRWSQTPLQTEQDEARNAFTAMIDAILTTDATTSDFEPQQ